MIFLIADPSRNTSLYSSLKVDSLVDRVNRKIEILKATFDYEVHHLDNFFFAQLESFRKIFKAIRCTRQDKESIQTGFIVVNFQVFNKLLIVFFPNHVIELTFLCLLECKA